MLSMVFNRQVLKLAVALAIPGLIIWAFIWAQKSADIELKETKESIKGHQSNQVKIDNYEMKEVDDANHIRWRLVAKTGVVDQKTELVNLQDVKVDYYDGPKIKMRIFAPHGEGNQSTKYVKLTSGEGRRVEAEGQEGKAKMLASQVELKEKNKFVATGGVNIDWPRVAKVRGERAEGKVNLADFKDFKIIGNTHAEIFMD